MWTPHSTIRELVKTNAAPATGTTTLRYLYDAAGNRVVKDYHATQNTTLTSRTWYIRDAQGTVLAIYTRKPTAGNSGSVTRTEAPIYGSSRIGQSTRTATYDATASGEATLLGTVYSRELGKRAYELVDHLGNVRATISDILVPRTATNTYDADILTLTDYYPFGMQMDTRTWEAGGSSDYRYGYNTQERSDEIAGEGNHYTAEFWEYDPRAARRWNLDPKPVMGISQYAAFQLDPIGLSDFAGDSVEATTDRSATRLLASIHDGMSGDQNSGVRSLFRLDGRKLAGIDPARFEAMSGSLSDDQYALAKGYMLLANSSEKHWFTAIARNERATELELSLGGSFGFEGDPSEDLHTKLLESSGGGMNLPLSGGGSYTAIAYGVFGAKHSTGDYYVSATSLPLQGKTWLRGEIQAHELIGHGLMRVILGSSNDAIHAIQIGNAYLRARGIQRYYRNDAGHNGGPGKEKEVQRLPSVLQR